MVASWLSAAFDAFLDNVAMPSNKHIGSINTSPGHSARPFNRFVDYINALVHPSNRSVDHIYTFFDNCAQHTEEKKEGQEETEGKEKGEDREEGVFFEQHQQLLRQFVKQQLVPR